MTAIIVVAIAMVGAALLLSVTGKERRQPVDPPIDSVIQRVGGIESITIDEHRYFFGFSHSDDQPVSPLFGSANEMAHYATKNMRQRDGSKDESFWVREAIAAEAESQLSTAPPNLNTSELRQILAAARTAISADNAVSEAALDPSVVYLLEMNCDWPEQGPPKAITDSVLSLGLPVDDMSPWLDESMRFLSTREPLPSGARYADAARVFSWYLEELIQNQRFGWAEQILGKDREPGV